MVASLVGSVTARFRRSAVAVATVAAMLGGCASTDTGAAEVWDPLEAPNRFIFSLNRAVDRIAFRSIATGPRYGATAIDARSRTLFALDDLEKNSVDYYAALKSAYTQQRADLIRQKREKTDGKAELDRRDNLALVR